MNSFWFHEKCQSVLFITFKHHHVSTANEPKKGGGALSSNSHTACPSPAPVKALGTNCPAQGRTEGEGRGRAVSRPAVWHSPAGSSGSLPLHVFSSHIHQHPFSPLSGPWAPPPPSAPTSPWIGRLSSNKCFISCIDGCLGIAAPVTHQIEHRARFNLRGDRSSLAEMKCGWLQFPPAAHGAVRPSGLWEQCQEGPERTEESFHCGARVATEAGGEVPVTAGGKPKSLQAIFHSRWKLGHFEGQTDKITAEN